MRARSLSSLLVLTPALCLLACGGRVGDPASGEDDTTASALSAADPAAGITDLQLAALVRADAKTMDADMDSPVSAADAPQAVADTASAHWTYHWHGITNHTLVSRDGVWVYGRVALQTAYYGGVAKDVRAYAALHCYLISYVGWQATPCSVSGNFNLYHDNVTNYFTDFTTSNTGSDGFYSRYGGWHGTACTAYEAELQANRIGIHGRYYAGSSLESFEGWHGYMASPLYTPSSDCPGV